jgi:hypothetical protein
VPIVGFGYTGLNTTKLQGNKKGKQFEMVFFNFCFFSVLDFWRWGNLPTVMLVLTCCELGQSCNCWLLRSFSLLVRRKRPHAYILQHSRKQWKFLMNFSDILFFWIVIFELLKWGGLPIMRLGSSLCHGLMWLDVVFLSCNCFSFKLLFTVVVVWCRFVSRGWWVSCCWWFT